MLETRSKHDDERSSLTLTRGTIAKLAILAEHERRTMKSEVEVLVEEKMERLGLAPNRKQKLEVRAH
jgi:hypothetical protein